METVVIVLSGLVVGVSCVTMSAILGRRLLWAHRKGGVTSLPGLQSLPDLDDAIGQAPLYEEAL